MGFTNDVKKKKIRKIGILAIVLILIAIAFYRFNIVSVNDAERKGKSQLEKGEIQVEMEIDCKTLLGNNKVNLKNKSKAKYIPEDGIILKKSKYKVKDGDSAFDLLKNVALKEKIHMEHVYTEVYNSYYVKGINNLYERDGGKMSGWHYYVNGKYINYGSSEYKLKKGDFVQWKYTCNGGKDITFE